MSDFNRDDWRLNSDNLIANPGKFQGEPIWAPYFYQYALGGLYDDFLRPDGSTETIIELVDSDLDRFPDIPKTSTHMSLIEKEDGFVLSEYLNAQEYDERIRDYENESVPSERMTEAELLDGLKEYLPEKR